MQFVGEIVLEGKFLKKICGLFLKFGVIEVNDMKEDAELKKLREVKGQKICEEMKPTIADSNIDAITLNDVQQLLQNKIEADLDEKKSKVPAKYFKLKKTSPELRERFDSS